MPSNIVPTLINDGEKVIIQKGDVFQVLRVQTSRFINLEKYKIPMEGIIGQRMGTSFSFDGKTVSVLPFDHPDVELEDLSVNSSKDNRHLHDRPENQSLSSIDIKSLKCSGTTGNEMLTKLVENSTSFHLKTQFSQEKYLKKKKKMYHCVFTVRPFNSRNLADMQSITQQYKSISLRHDTLSQLLMYSNVHASSTVLLTETYGGLLTKALLERLGHKDLGGRIIQFFHGTSPPQLDSHSPSDCCEILPVQFSDITSLLLTGKYRNSKYNTSDNSVVHTATEQDNCSNTKIPRLDDNITCKLASQEVAVDNDLEECRRRQNMERKAKKQADLETARTILCPMLNNIGDENADECVLPDSLIVATKFYPVEITLLLLQFLPPGRPFVVHSHLLSPLVDLYNLLKRRGSCTQMWLHDSWLRSMQVLPARTHPEVKMVTGGAGFMLRGYTVERVEDAGAVHSQLKIAQSTRQLFSEGIISYANLSV